MSAPAASRFDPTSPEQREDPFAVLALARREQPVFYSEQLGLWVVTRDDDVLAVLKDHRTFSSVGALRSSSTPHPPDVVEVLAQGYPDMPYIIEVDPPVHDRIRGLLAREFTPRRVDALEPRIHEIASELIAEYLVRQNVPYVFGICGHGNVGMLDALYGVRDKVKGFKPTSEGSVRLENTEVPA